MRNQILILLWFFLVYNEPFCCGWLQDFLFVFQCFNYDVSRCEYLCVYPTWSSLNFFHIRLMFFIKLGKFWSLFLRLIFLFPSGEESIYMFVQVVRIQVLVLVELKSLFHCWLPAEGHFQFTGPPTFLAIYSLPFLKPAMDNISCIKSFSCFTSDHFCF